VILDSSALIAVLLRQAGHEALLDRLSADEPTGVGAPTLVETGIVLSARLGVLGKTLLARYLQEREVAVIPFDAEHWTVAVDAFIRFGKGRHAAALNLGDCMTYATAHLEGEPLLCLGDDFAQTDLPLAR
jgi:ribonuclease VapC